MSFFKYFGETSDEDGTRLSWPGGPAGFPFRGNNPPTTKLEEYENLQLSGKARWRLFYLAKPEDAKAYTAVRDKCANGYYALVDRDRQWDEETKNYRIFMEWVEIAYDVPPPTEAFKDVKSLMPTPGINIPLAGLRNGSEGW